MAKTKLTDRTVKALKPIHPKTGQPLASGERYGVMDTLVPGFGVRVGDKGKRTYVLRARYPTGPHASWRAIGDCEVLTLEKAREKAREWLKLIRAGKDPAAEEERERQANLRQQANTFSVVAEAFIKRHVSKTRKAAIVERELRREFIERWGDRPITDIAPRDVVTIIEEVVDRGAPYQAHNLLGHVRTLFNWAIARDIYGLDRSPCDRLKPAAVIGKKLARKRVLNDPEIRALWRACDVIGYPYGPLFRLLLLTGQRKSEVAEARWSEFDFEGKLWTIPAARMKADAAHVVPLTAEAIEVLASLPRFRNGECLFTTTHGKKPVSGFSKAKNRLDQEMLAAGVDKLEPFVIHDIRRTVRTGLSSLPIQELVRELVIAHTKPGLHKVYDRHAYLSEKREALTLWAARLRAIVEPAPDNVVRLHAVTKS
jgi:integrase